MPPSHIALPAFSVVGPLRKSMPARRAARFPRRVSDFQVLIATQGIPLRLETLAFTTKNSYSDVEICNTPALGVIIRCQHRVMSLNIGLDIGAVSLKLAALGEPEDRATLQSLCCQNPAFRLIEWATRPLLLSEYRRIGGSPIQSAYNLLEEVYARINERYIEGLRVTGSGSRALARILGIYFENEFKAIARALVALHPEVRTIFEIGGESSKYILLERSSDGACGILDYDRSGECAAGTGSFLDQQALRMGYSVAEIGELRLSTGFGPL